MPNNLHFKSLIESATDYNCPNSSSQFKSLQVIQELGNVSTKSSYLSEDYKKRISLFFLNSIDFMQNCPLGVPFFNHLNSLMNPIKYILNIDIDDAKLKEQLRETSVLNSKDYTKWGWKEIELLFNFTFQDEKKLKESMKTKFIKRLLKFFTFQTRKFSLLPWVE